MKTSRWRMFVFYLSPRRWWALRRRQQRLFWFAAMKKNAEAALLAEKDPPRFAMLFRSFVSLSVRYSKCGGFEQGRVTERLMRKTKPT